MKKVILCTQSNVAITATNQKNAVNSFRNGSNVCKNITNTVKNRKNIIDIMTMIIMMTNAERLLTATDAKNCNYYDRCFYNECASETAWKEQQQTAY